MQDTRPWLVIKRNLIINDKKTEPEVFEGELPMADAPPQLPNAKDIIGNGLARTTVSYGFGHKSYGNGGEVMVSVTLTHDQSNDGLYWGHEVAKAFAMSHAERNLAELEQKLVQMGLVAPPSNS